MNRRTHRIGPAATFPAWHIADTESVRALLARAAPNSAPHTSIGEIALLPHQQQALARIREIIRRFHGALLADDVGLGKTYVALALARDYPRTHVIAPAALLPMWRTAIARTESSHVQLRSLHAFSIAPRHLKSQPGQGNDDGVLPTDRQRALVIIDEAHHLRNANTLRYKAIADFTSGRDVLLLSATPLHNTPHDLRHLAALVGTDDIDPNSPQSVGRLIVRQTADVLDLAASAGKGDDASASQRPATPPRVQEHAPIRVPHDHATLDAILTLPAPLAARDGAVAGALIRLGLLRAWCSSDAALGNAVRRRILRGEALRQAILAGRHPSPTELRTWLVGDHEVQLAFAELLAPEVANSDSLLAVLERHLAALRVLLQHQARCQPGDQARALALRRIVETHHATPVVAFSQFASTVQSLYRALADIAGVGALTGMHARIASGRIARLDAIDRFAPHAQGRPPPPPHQAIRLLLATDLIAEGVNLQDAGVIVHLDLPWTDALQRQRVGRVARLGSAHATVHVYRLAPPDAGDHALRLTERLLHKSLLAEQLVGRAPQHTGLVNSPSASPGTGRRTPPSAAELATRLHALLSSWRLPGALASASVAGDSIPVAIAHASHQGWIAAITDRHGVGLIASLRRTGADISLLWTATSSVLEGVPDAGIRRSGPSPGVAHIPTARDVRTALHQLQRHLHRERTLGLAGHTSANGTRAQRAALIQIAGIAQRLPALQRWSHAREFRDAESVVRGGVGIGPQRALTAWVASARAGTHVEWLSKWREWPALVRVADQHHGNSRDSRESQSGQDETAAVVIALLLLRRVASGKLPGPATTGSCVLTALP